jgi:N-acetyltransferase 10
VRARPSALWCYKKELGFSSHKQKRMKQIKKLKGSGLYNQDVDDPFETFVASTDIRYCYYKDSHKVLGQTFGMLVLQDFESITPNVLCRTIETVEGGGIVVLLINTMTSLKQLYSLSMDSHQKYKTESMNIVEPRFNERFILSLKDCKTCIAMDDELNILPITSHMNDIKAVNLAGEGVDKDISSLYLTEE